MPQDERVASTARVNVPGSSAEPVGDLFRDRGSPPLAPVGELFAEPARRPPRSSDTKDLSASLRSDRRCGDAGRVLNLCEGGMLLEGGSDLEVAETVGFELVGPYFRYAGLATIAHREDGAIGLRFLSWDGPVDRPVRALIAARLCGQPPGFDDPGKVGIRPPTMWDSRGHDRAAVSGLAALIEASPGATTRRHQVLNVSEQGMLIDGLALLPAGDRISFVLAGRGINHVGCGRVVHRTGTGAGVAVDHWHGAPEAIRGLITGEIDLGPQLVDAYIADWS
jgi:hypothetical protein